MGLSPREPVSDVRSLFRSKCRGGPTVQQPPKKAARVVSWSHKFVCLDQRGQDTIPTTDTEKDALFEAGLGEKSITVPNIDCDYVVFRRLLVEHFPKLEDSGKFLFAKCRANT